MNYRKWTKEDLEFIKNNTGTLSDHAIASKLGEMTGSNISVAMVRTQRRKIGLKKIRGRHSKNNTKSLIANN